jgi:predicted PurR-regulated permease PerM
MINTDRLLMQIALLLLLVACIWVVLPFISALLWGAILAFASWPLMRRLNVALGGRPTLAAGILTGMWVLLVLLPLVWLGFNLAEHVRDATGFIRDVQLEGLPPAPTWVANLPLVGERLSQLWASMDAQGAAFFQGLKPHLGQVGNWLLARSARLGSGLIELALALVFTFFFYRDGPRLSAFALRLLERLMGERGEYYLDLIAGTVQRVVNGVIGTAAAQAVLALIGFMIAGIPGALVLGIFTFLLSLIPMGPPLAWIPAVGWLIWQEHYAMAVFLGLWGTFVVSGVDNVLKPYLISRGGDLPVVIVLVGVFGGLLAFGFIGLFLGPTFLAVGYRLMTDWARERA